MDSTVICVFLLGDLTRLVWGEKPLLDVSWIVYALKKWLNLLHRLQHWAGLTDSPGKLSRARTIRCLQSTTPRNQCSLELSLQAKDTASFYNRSPLPFSRSFGSFYITSSPILHMPAKNFHKWVSSNSALLFLICILLCICLNFAPVLLISFCSS